MKVGQPLGNYIHSNKSRKGANQFFLLLVFDWQAGGEIVGICRGLAGKSTNTRISFARGFLKGMK